MERYNGWENRETWAAHLWLTSDEGLCNVARRADTPDQLREMVEELMDKREGNPTFVKMFDDIGSLWRVNWRAVHAALREE